MKNCVLSLIIPTYNCSLYLKETLDSVLCQMPDDCELIVVDDGSDDDTVRILEQYEGGADNLVIMQEEHKGVSGARNTGLRLASGEFLAFMDCDDLLKRDFYEKCLPAVKSGADLCIFGFDRVEADGTVIPFTVNDRIYENASDFSDDYIRCRNLLIYSACNKIYRKEIITRCGIRFRENVSFGEDRLFNYDYLRYCSRILSSSLKMFDYMQRRPDSASRKSFNGYYDTILMLHKAKMDCFLSLSEGTTMEEKKDFVGYDLSNEIGRTIDRFEEYPEEKCENLPKINDLLFGRTDDAGDVGDVPDYLIVLGSTNCGYRIRRALELSGTGREPVYVLSGGGLYKDGARTEAAFMSDYLLSAGIPAERILIEDKAKNTFGNLVFSAEVIQKSLEAGYTREGNMPLRIGIVTGGFHIQRTRMLTKKISWYTDRNLVFISVYGEHTGPENWYMNPVGKELGLSEISKTAGAFYQIGIY